MSISYESSGSELTVPDEEEEDKFNLGLYIGERNAASQRHGRGWAILPNGDQYDGQYRQGKRHGIGLYVFKGGARYYGRYRCGHRSGRGIFIYPDGSMYEGSWRKSVKHGKGRYIYANGDTYTGDWYRGLRHGIGIYIFGCSESCIIRFKGTWRKGLRVGPFEVYFDNEEKNFILHGTWDKDYPQGPAVFNFSQRYMLMGYFQAADAGLPKQHGDDASEFLEGFEQEDEQQQHTVESIPPDWFAQEIGIYDYSQLPQEPVPLPLSDSDVSICSLSTTPTELSVEKRIIYIGEGEDEGDEAEQECGPCECEFGTSEIESDSEPCPPEAPPCAIDAIKDTPY